MEYRSLFTPLLEAEIIQEVDSQATFYDDFVKVFIPNLPIQKLAPGYEARTKKKQSGHNKESIETDEERSLRRTRATIRDYALCNSFTHFITFTFRNNRFDDDEKRRQMHNWLKNQRKKWGTFDYLVVNERHKNGALHFHGMFRYPGKVISLREGKQSLASFTLGYSDVTVIESRSNTARYISKYITKDMPLFPGKKRFWSSKGLQRPLKIDNPPDWILAQTPSWQAKTEYGTTLFFPYSSKLTELREELYGYRGERFS